MQLRYGRAEARPSDEIRTFFAWRDEFYDEYYKAKTPASEPAPAVRAKVVGYKEAGYKKPGHKDPLILLASSAHPLCCAGIAGISLTGFPGGAE
jgi:hypothetical protein